MHCDGVVETGLVSGSYYNVAVLRDVEPTTLISYLTENTVLRLQRT